MKKTDWDMRIHSLPWSRTVTHEIRNPFLKETALFKLSFTNPLKQRRHQTSKLPVASKFSSTNLELGPKAEHDHSRIDTIKDEDDKLVNEADSSLKPGPNTAIPVIKKPEDTFTDVMLQIETPYLAKWTENLQFSFAEVYYTPPSTKKEANERRVTFVQTKAEEGKICLLLDLDETLIYTITDSQKGLSKETEKKLHTLSFIEDGSLTQCKFLLRPGLNRFLALLADKYDITVPPF